MSPKMPDRKPFFTSRKYLDFDEFEEAIRSWQLEILRLDNRPTKNVLTQFDTGEMLVSHALFTGRTHQTGDPPNGLLTCAVLADPTSHLIWRKKEISPNQLMIFHPGSEIDSVTRGKLVEVFTFSFSLEFICHFTAVGKSCDGKNILSSDELIELPAPIIEDLRKCSSSALSSLRQDASLIENKQFQYSVNIQIAENLASCLPFYNPQDGHRLAEKRRRIWQQIEAYIRANNQRHLLVKEVASQVGISESTLLRTFKSRYGMPPKAYLNAHRLNAVRRILKRSPSRKGKIIEVANALGFWHMGQFAKDYKKLFGELPSETFRRMTIRRD